MNFIIEYKNGTIIQEKIKNIDFIVTENIFIYERDKNPHEIFNKGIFKINENVKHISIE